ncbi:MAG: LTA synthase family protein [Bacteroidales bacterium]|nr:LTA synthase family protein [Bacteroidales bacterium]
MQRIVYKSATKNITNLLYQKTNGSFIKFITFYINFVFSIMQLKFKDIFQINISKILFINIFILLIYYTLCRLLFLIFNFNYLLIENNDYSFSYWLFLFLGGLKFDICAITIINIPFIFLSILPFKFRNNKYYQKIVKIIFFYAINIITIAFNFIDIIYSRFTLRRMTFDVFKFIKTEGGFSNLISDFFKDFWYIAFIFIILSALFIFINAKIKFKENDNKSNIRFFLTNIFQIILITGLCFLGIRCSFGQKPLSIITTSKYSNPEHKVLVLNTPFTLIKTINKELVERKDYFSKKELSEIYQPIFYPNLSNNQLNSNVVIIILESFSLEYSAILNSEIQESSIPCFDSIARLGQIIQAFSNGTRSIEGIPSIISGIPTLMNTEFINSNYAENVLTSIPSILKKYGYTSAFFHGGKNGTLNFDSYAFNAGFDYYFGKNEYHNDKDYDHAWGIFDDAFLKYFKENLDTLHKPFFASFFSLSSHHPYVLPNNYKKTHNTSKPNMQQSIKYTDWALGQFFEMASKSDWYENTIFILTADHASQPQSDFFKTSYGSYLIPLIFYSPKNNIPKINKEFAQQIDILPSVVDLLNIKDTIFTFGKSVFDNFPPFAINYNNNYYRFYINNHEIIFDGDKINYYFDFKSDKYLWNNLVDTENIPEKDEDFMKAFIQIYNNALIDNMLTIKSLR